MISYISDELCSALWNLHLYYKQFEEHISTHINNLGAAVRKNLNDLVKITRWNDINYWSVVKGVEKTHEQLMKHIKEYQVCWRESKIFNLSIIGVNLFPMNDFVENS